MLGNTKHRLLPSSLPFHLVDQVPAERVLRAFPQPRASLLSLGSETAYLRFHLDQKACFFPLVLKILVCLLFAPCMFFPDFVTSGPASARITRGRDTNGHRGVAPTSYSPHSLVSLALLRSWSCFPSLHLQKLPSFTSLLEFECSQPLHSQRKDWQENTMPSTSLL